MGRKEVRVVEPQSRNGETITSQIVIVMAKFAVPMGRPVPHAGIPAGGVGGPRRHRQTWAHTPWLWGGPSRNDRASRSDRVSWGHMRDGHRWGGSGTMRTGDGN